MLHSATSAMMCIICDKTVPIGSQHNISDPPHASCWKYVSIFVPGYFIYIFYQDTVLILYVGISKIYFCWFILIIIPRRFRWNIQIAPQRHFTVECLDCDKIVPYRSQNNISEYCLWYEPSAIHYRSSFIPVISSKIQFWYFLLEYQKYIFTDSF